jgi:hypothetical protein
VNDYAAFLARKAQLTDDGGFRPAGLPAREWVPPGPGGRS